MNDICANCPIRTGCDIFSAMCRLKANEVLTIRPDLVKPMDKHQRHYLKRKRTPKFKAQVAAASRRWRESNPLYKRGVSKREVMELVRVSSRPPERGWKVR